ncbi:hypothetical protein GYA28_01940 [Candidatus Roizmanbacteria bacterium]|jgi:ABC-2 type transport system permease protein|nr:hypothetical protein [Candidatus Roizmanbacteria bacterium]
MFKKYQLVFSTTVKEYFAYRLNFVLWRLRMFIYLASTYFFWQAVFEKNITFGHYDKSAILSYILYVSLISNFVFGTRTSDIAAEINDGSIINWLLKPISFFRLYMAKDLVDKIMNIAFSLFEVWLIVYFFKAPLIAPKNILLASLFFINGLAISFYVNMMLSFIGFWTTEVWAPRFVFMIMVLFAAGTYFPLDILPPLLYKIMIMTPFPYLFFMTTRTLVGRTDGFVLFEVLISFFWVIACFFLAKRIWKKGNKSFSFWGR